MSGDCFSYSPTEIWWPHPSALDDLTVEETEEGFALSAPDDTECGDWLAYFNETDERREAFQNAFTESLLEHLKRTENGQSQNVPDGAESDCLKAENVSAGVQP